jgi:cyclic pyranopterin phosphate synthase
VNPIPEPSPVQVSERTGLFDAHGRRHTSLRLSITDRCNIRCQYCMPAEGAEFLPERHLLPLEDVVRVVDYLGELGIDKVRITGGEPLLRRGVPRLVAQLRRLEHLKTIALTTNGMLLAPIAGQLREAGLDRINISLDTLRPETFQRISRRAGLEQVLEGIHAAQAAQLDIRLNALMLREVNLDDCLPLAQFAREAGLPLRFIEFMPLDADRRWSETQLVTGAELRRRLSEHFGVLEPLPRSDPSQPSSDYRYRDGGGLVGFIDPVSEPFCSQCNRLRLSADGKLRNCLFGRDQWDLKNALAAGEVTEAAKAVRQVARACVAAKHPAHGIGQPQFVQPPTAMYRIGG